MLYLIILTLTFCLEGCLCDLERGNGDDSLYAVLPKVKESLQITIPSGTKDYVRPHTYKSKENGKPLRTKCKHSCKGWPHEHCKTKITAKYAHHTKLLCRFLLKLWCEYPDECCRLKLHSSFPERRWCSIHQLSQVSGCQQGVWRVWFCVCQESWQERKERLQLSEREEN